MNLLAGIKALGGGIASIPGHLNEARFNHANVNVPAASMPRMSGAGVDPDEMVVIGKNPDTGEDITIPQSQLGQFGMDPATGQVMGQQRVRTGPSKFGNFLKNGLPRMLDAGIAAATSPGDGSGGFLAALKGMDIGRDRLQKRDMLAYQMHRQRTNDQALDEQRHSAAAENRMQAEMYRRKMDAPPATPAQREPTTWEAELVQMHRQALQAGDMEKANAIADKMNEMRMGGRAGGLHNVGGALYDEKSGQWLTPPKEKPPAPHVQRGTFWKEDGDGFEVEVANIWDPNEKKMYSQPVDGSRRKKEVKKTNPAGRGPQRTPTQQDALAARKQADDFMRQAGQSHDKALEIAKQANAPLAVQGLILDAKHKLRFASPTPKAATPKGPNLSGGPAWKRTQAFGGGK